MSGQVRARKNSGRNNHNRWQAGVDVQISVRNRMCGRGGVAGGVTITSWRDCTGSTGRRSLQTKVGEWSAGSSASSEEEDRKARSLEAENKELRAGFMPWNRKKEHKRSQVSLKEEGGIRKKNGEIVWKSRMRPSLAENWMYRGKSCRRSYEKLTNCPFKESLEHQMQVEK